MQEGLLAVFQLHDGRFVYIHALSDYYSGYWQGIAVRVYIVLYLESLEECGMGFKVSAVQSAVMEQMLNSEIEVDPGEHRRAWEALTDSFRNVDQWLLCNFDEHSGRRGNRANPES